MSSYAVNLDISLLVQELIGVSQSSGVVGTVERRIKELVNLRYRPADGANKLLAYLDTQSGVAASQTQDYDLVGTLTDLDGTTLSFDLVYLVILVNQGATYAITCGPKGSTTWGVGATEQGFWADASDRTYVPPGGFVILHSPTGVPASAGSDVFQVLTAGGTSANAWSMLVVGRDNA
jgi:hypothetical protein